MTLLKASSPTEQKKALRAALRKRRLALGPEEYEAWSRRACRHILESEAWQRARVVALYCPTGNEVDTRWLLEDAWAGASPKTVLLPVCVNRSGDMYFSPCRGAHELEPGVFGILAPRSGGAGGGPVCGVCAPVEAGAAGISPAVPDLVIVPLLGFGPEGARLGGGGGYYDRMFSRPEYAGATRLGLAFTVQKVANLPRQPWDVPLQGVCTQEGIQWFR